MNGDAWSAIIIALFIVALAKFDWLYEKAGWLADELRYPGGKEEE